MYYSNEVLEYFFNTQHVGILQEPDSQVMWGEIGSREQGYLFRLYVRYDHTTIKEAKFQAYGSVTTTAACEYVCRWLENKTFEEAKQLTSIQIQNALNLSAFESHAALLIQRLTEKTLEKNK
ncbi:iron-sulfur cluster assembly scaffold protein [Coxiella endosymbiont of Rhipicephalus microplus]|uniref:iron-sulfur cluster assembly scaffold protein n=1 Tax=Coxiella endosymbiont of Rhipicephalus microplus TaxID=1656186 RepID=UPI000C80C492|nr:iron-sulfur cluster assembly scaffold protein [Coxiella endosymbiont of Rhipicephalus microplus]PMB54666.1 Iron-sulfur cluster assembly scaffold protein IscU [Coxiella-like endosymbiont]